MLQVGASIICNQAQYTVAPGDVGAALVTNTVSVATGSVNPVPASPPAVAHTTVTLLTCDSSHPTSDPLVAILPGTNTTWGILNNTGTTLHPSGATITWSGANLEQIILGGQSVWNGSVPPNGTLSLPTTGWPALPYTNPPTPVTMALKFSDPGGTSISISVTFQELVGGTGCSVTSP